MIFTMCKSFFVALAITALLTTAALAQPRTSQLSVRLDQRGEPMSIDHHALGQGGLSVEPMWDDRMVEIRSLRPAVIRLFIQEYFQLMPARGEYRFDMLDRSVDTILRTGARPLMCICFKPKVLFPTIDQDIVEPNDYAEWERLIEALVAHYKKRGDSIRYWEVGNEPDIGESGGCPYRFKPESYIRYYKHTAAAILRADPEAKVGGPALANVRSPILPALLDACENGGSPLHFVSWHIYNSDPMAVKGTIEYARAQISRRRGLSVETFLNEWNMDLQDPPLDPRYQPCYILETVWQMKDAGLDWSCYYHIRDYQVDDTRFAPFMSPEGTAFMTRWWNRMPQYDGLFDYQNRVRPSFFAFKLLSRLTGTRLDVGSTLPQVHALATHDEKFRIDNLLFWNFSKDHARLEIEVKGLPEEKLLRRWTLDALAPSDDENQRLRPDLRVRLPRGDYRATIELAPYEIRFWSFE